MGSRELPADVKSSGLENVVYTLTRRLQSGELVGRSPQIERRCRRMVKALQATHEASDRLRGQVRQLLPSDLSPTLVPAAERAIDAAGEALRGDLSRVFNEEIDRAVAAEQARAAAMYDCVKCGNGTKGNRMVPGEGWLCRAHIDAHECALAGASNTTERGH